MQHAKSIAAAFFKYFKHGSIKVGVVCAAYIERAHARLYKKAKLKGDALSSLWNLKSFILEIRAFF